MFVLSISAIGSSPQKSTSPTFFQEFSCSSPTQKWTTTFSEICSTSFFKCCEILENAYSKLLICLIVNPFCQVTQKNDFKRGPEQWQAFEQIKQEIVHAVALWPVWTGQDVKNVLYTAAEENGPTWRLWQKAPGNTQCWLLGFWSQAYRGSEFLHSPTEKEILTAYENIWATSEVIGTEVQLLLAPWLSMLDWTFKGTMSSTHHACMHIYICPLLHTQSK